MKFLLIVGSHFTMSCFGQELSYQSSHLSSEERAKALISRLTLDEKASLMQDQSPAIPRLGIMKFNRWSEALHGLANNNDVTFYKNSGQLGDFEDYSIKGRTYRFMSDALVPFGYGLNYTNFSIGNATPSSKTVLKNRTLTLTIAVSNTGKRNGTELVQVYIRKTDDVNGPLKTLRGFQRVEFPAGKTGIVKITLPYRAYEFYSNAKRKMTVAAGEYEVWYGNSSATKDLKMAKVTVN